MYSTVLQILTVFFVVSLLPVFYIIFFKQKGSITLLEKYMVYLLLALGSIYIIDLGYAFFWAISIAVLGFFEILSYIKLYNKNRIWVVIIYLLFALDFTFVVSAPKTDNNNILYVYTLVLIFDGMSQLGGQIAGKRKLTPRISPNKTWEGFITGLVFCYVSSICIQMQLPNLFSNYIYWMGPFLISIAALCGDLLASYYKRACGIKDFSSVLPGHGGILDRFDSVMGAAWVILLYQMLL